MDILAFFGAIWMMILAGLIGMGALLSAPQLLVRISDWRNRRRALRRLDGQVKAYMEERERAS